jgi:hypothetical protein
MRTARSCLPAATFLDTLAADAGDVPEPIPRDARSLVVANSAGPQFASRIARWKRDLIVDLAVDVARPKKRNAKDPLDAFHAHAFDRRPRARCAPMASTWRRQFDVCAMSEHVRPA